jgi:hypothetical protein
MNQASSELPLHSCTPRNERGVRFVLSWLSQPLTRNCGASNLEFFQPGFYAPQMLRSEIVRVFCISQFSLPQSVFLVRRSFHRSVHFLSIVGFWRSLLFCSAVFLSQAF